MPFTDRDKIVQAFAADRADGPFAQGARLGNALKRSENPLAKMSNGLIELEEELPVTVADQESVS